MKFLVIFAVLCLVQLSMQSPYGGGRGTGNWGEDRSGTNLEIEGHGNHGDHGHHGHGKGHGGHGDHGGHGGHNGRPGKGVGGEHGTGSWGQQGHRGGQGLGKSGYGGRAMDVAQQRAY